MINKEIISLFASTISIYSLYPQIRQIIKTGKSKDISYSSTNLRLLGTFLWIIYSLLIKDYCFVIGNIIFLILNFIIIFYKIKNED